MNREDVAWLAGVYCGEGSCQCIRHKTKPNTKQLQLVIGQSGHETPEMLVRAQRILGFGKIQGPYKKGYNPNYLPVWKFALGSFEKVQAAIAMMWEWLTPEKKEQAKKALLCYGENRG